MFVRGVCVCVFCVTHTSIALFCGYFNITNCCHYCIAKTFLTKTKFDSYLLLFDLTEKLNVCNGEQRPGRLVGI